MMFVPAHYFEDSSMKAIVATHYGSPDVLQLTEVENGAQNQRTTGQSAGDNRHRRGLSHAQLQRSSPILAPRSHDIRVQQTTTYLRHGARR